MLKYYIEKIKKPFVWVRRFRNRRGYGVHSPFAFNFITIVLFQRGQYYNYKKINELPRTWGESKKILKLIFRLVNFLQPKTIVYRSENKSLPQVMLWAKHELDISESLEANQPVDMAYLTYKSSTEVLEEEVDLIWPRLHSRSMLVVYGVGYSKEMRSFWERIIKDEKSGISFDLYDVGILFFDKTRTKQDYTVNF